MFPSESSNFFVTLETPTDFGLEQTNEVASGIERGALDPLVGEYIDDHFTTVGSAIAGNDDRRIAPNLAVSFLWIKDTEGLRLHPESAVRAAQERLDAYRAEFPDGIVSLRAKPPRNGPPIGRPVSMRILSNDWQLAKQIANEAQSYLAGLPGVYNIEDDLKLSSREFRLIVDEERATRHGLSFRDLATALRGANDGLRASSYRGPLEDEEQDIRVMLEARYRSGIESLLQTEVRTPGGYLLRLGDVASVEISRGFREFKHFDRKRAVTVFADVEPDVISAQVANQRLEARFSDVPLRYPEVALAYGGQGQATQEAVAKMIAVFPVAVLLIYCILAGLFRSYLQPVVVAIAIPFGFMGVVAGTWMLNYSFSMYIMYATLGLTGVVVNDSLVMVDFINRARASGMPLLEAVRLSGARRLRPILLTTLTTVVALLPMAFGLHGGSRSFGPFAAAITFGLVAAMFGTLFAVPLAYTLLLRFQSWFGRRIAVLRGLPARSEVPPVARDAARAASGAGTD
jgi:HAE1 family hydrophobic/amphiphilic exporter-1